MSHHDAHILTGMDAIINPENIKPSIDLKELERQMISGGLITPRTKDPQDRFNDELKAAAGRLGISFGDQKPTPRKSAPTIPKASPVESLRSSPVASPVPRDDMPIDYGAPVEPHYEPSPEPAPPTPPARPANRFSDTPRQKYTDDFQQRTMEQERREHIDTIVGSGGNCIPLETEKKEDMKHAMLAEIDLLIETLADEDMDLSRVPTVNRMSDYGEIETTLRMLRRKNDHARYCSFADEFILFGANAMEELFDGKRTWFGRYSPDLTGWSRHVNVKLKRMKHDTGQIVSDITQDYNVSPGMRLLLELLPNMLLYSKMRKQQHGQDGLCSDAEMMAAQNRIRNITEK